MGGSTHGGSVSGLDDESAERLNYYKLSPEEVETEVDQLTAAIPVAENRVVRLQKDLVDCIVESLDKLEALELHRIESQQRAVKHAVEAERHFFKVLNREALVLQAASKKVAPPEDMASFSKAFTAKLERVERENARAESGGGVASA